MNITFWVIVVLIQYNNLPLIYQYNRAWYYTFILLNLLPLLSLTYINIFALIPRFLKNKKYLYYILATVLLTIFIAALSDIINKSILHFFNKIKIYEITFFEVELNTEWTFKSFFAETLSFCIAYINVQFLFVAAWYFWNYSNEVKVRGLVEKRQIETELGFLKSQINPHFLFNSLNNLYSLAVKKSDKTPDAILKLSRLLRYILYESNEPKITFDKEKEAIEAFIDVELLRVANPNNLHFNIHSDREYYIPPLLWLPVLENVFKYGVNIISDEYLVEFEFIIINNTIFISSKNYFKQKKIADANRVGIGFDNLRKRLELLYHSKYRFDYYQKDKYFYVEIEIDIS